MNDEDCTECDKLMTSGTQYNEILCGKCQAMLDFVLGGEGRVSK